MLPNQEGNLMKLRDRFLFVATILLVISLSLWGKSVIELAISRQVSTQADTTPLRWVKVPTLSAPIDLRNSPNELPNPPPSRLGRQRDNLRR